MEISKKQIKKFQQIYKKEYGVDLTEEQAQVEGKKLIKLVYDVAHCLATDPVAAKNAQNFCDLMETWERERKDKAIKIDVLEKDQIRHMNSFSLG